MPIQETNSFSTQIESTQLSISLVTYHPDLNILQKTLVSLNQALAACHNLKSKLYLIDNAQYLSHAHDSNLYAFIEHLQQEYPLNYHIEIIAGHGNIGFGSAHNLVLDQLNSDYHLILNPDIFFEVDTLNPALTYLDVNPHIGLLAPSIYNHEHKFQYTNRRYPNILVLFLRGFAPKSISRFFHKQLAHYEMQDCINPNENYMNPLIHSGCFMLFRSNIFKQLQGFDERFFLYFEDYDLSLRCHKISQSIFFPSSKVLHLGGNSAQKGYKHIYYFIRSAAQFFNKHGWKFF